MFVLIIDFHVLLNNRRYLITGQSDTYIYRGAARGAGRGTRGMSLVRPPPAPPAPPRPRLACYGNRMPSPRSSHNNYTPMFGYTIKTDGNMQNVIYILFDDGFYLLLWDAYPLVVGDF